MPGHHGYNTLYNNDPGWRQKGMREHQTEL